jgi:hypothetical protein
MPEFDHFAPARYLAEHGGEFASAVGIEEALDRFEELFTTLNQLLDQC